MRRIIAISVMLVLLTGAAFAIEIGGDVQGTVNVLQGDTQKHAAPTALDPTAKATTKVTADGTLNRLRIEGSGQDEAGKYGGWIRVEGASPSINGLAWWKPLDQLKFIIGGNPDGFYGKDGITRWMFYQTASDVGVTNPGNAWGGSYGGGDWAGEDTQGADAVYGTFGNAFWGGFGENAAMLEITPADIFAFNLIIPFFRGGEAKDVFMQLIGQVDLKFDFGNIALTYIGGKGHKAGVDGTVIKPAVTGSVLGTDGKQHQIEFEPAEVVGAVDGYDDPSQIYLYFGGNFGSIGIDFGVGYKLPSKAEVIDVNTSLTKTKSFNNPLWVGLGVKFSTDSFGVKVRALGGFAGVDAYEPTTDKSEKWTHIRADILPYFNINETMRVYVSVGLGVGMGKDAMKGLTKDAKDTAGKDVSTYDGKKMALDWHFNPYLEVGQEWGPKFLFGFKLWSELNREVTKWAVPVALEVSF